MTASTPHATMTHATMTHATVTTPATNLDGTPITDPALIEACNDAIACDWEGWSGWDDYYDALYAADAMRVPSRRGEYFARPDHLRHCHDMWMDACRALLIRALRVDGRAGVLYDGKIYLVGCYYHIVQSRLRALALDIDL